LSEILPSLSPERPFPYTTKRVRLQILSIRALLEFQAFSLCSLVFFSKRKTTGETEGMDGGALIGSGAYGCVFDPPLHVLSRENGKCTKLALNSKAVGKISKSDEVHNEIEASKIISQVSSFLS
jgi:hypothetical protein